jgi:hypothetical protein
MHEIRNPATKNVTPSSLVLGVRVFGIQIHDTIEQMETLIRTGQKGRVIAFIGMNGVSEVRKRFAPSGDIEHRRFGCAGRDASCVAGAIA